MCKYTTAHLEAMRSQEHRSFGSKTIGVARSQRSDLCTAKTVHHFCNERTSRRALCPL